MNKLKFLLFTFFAISIMVGIYSCAKDVTKNEQHEKSLTEEQIKELKEMLGFEEDFVESRSLLGEASCGNTTEGCFLIGTAVKDTFLIPGTNCYAEATYDLYRCLSPGSAIIVSHVFNNFSAFPIDGMGFFT